MPTKLWIATVALVLGAPLAHAELLYSNGTIITNPTGGAGGFAASRYSSDFATYGFSGLSPARLADDFTLPASQSWNVQSITLQAYITGSYSIPPVSSPLTGAAARIWSGPPDAEGSALLAQSTTVTANTFSGIWRTTTSNPLETARPVFDLTIDFGSVILAPGHYWIDYSLAGNGNPFSPMVMDLSPAGAPLTHPGNAMRKSSPDGDWVTLFGGTGPQGLDFPFTLSGTVIIPEPTTTLPLLLLPLLTHRRR